MAQILVVEDESIVAHDIEQMLEDLGHVVPAFAFTGEEAIQKAEEIHPDLVLMDIMLKGSIDGIEAAEHIRTHDNIPVVYITAHTNEETLQRAKISEPFGYILKPIRSRELHVTIEMALYKSKVKKKLIESRKRLQESEEQFRNLFENAVLGVYRTTPDGRILMANPALVHMLEYSSFEELSQLNLEKEGFEPEYPRSAFKERIERDGQIVGLESAWIRRDGTTLFVRENARVVLDDVGNVLYYEGTIEDITERKKAEEELMRLSTAVRMTSDSIVITDIDMVILDVNEAALRMYGASKKEDLVGKNALSIIAPEDRRKAQASIEEALKKGSAGNLECDAILEDGSRITVETSMTIMKDAEGKSREIVNITRDITERKKAEKRMKRRLMKFDLEDGILYLIREPMSIMSIEAFKDLLKVGYPGLVVSRTPKKQFKNTSEYDFEYVWIAERADEPAIPPDLKEIEHRIEALVDPTAILIDRLDYLVFKTGYEETLSFVQHVREIAYLRNHIVILCVDPSTLEKRELRQLEKETKEIELLHKARLAEDLLEVLTFVYRQNIVGVKPSYTDIRQETGVSEPTIRKKIRTLINHGYLTESRKGRSKVVELTEKSRFLFLR